jgi:hypothetical protein
MRVTGASSQSYGHVDIVGQLTETSPSIDARSWRGRARRDELLRTGAESQDQRDREMGQGDGLGRGTIELLVGPRSICVFPPRTKRKSIRSTLLFNSVTSTPPKNRPSFDYRMRVSVGLWCHQCRIFLFSLFRAYGLRLQASSRWSKPRDYLYAAIHAGTDHPLSWDAVSFLAFWPIQPDPIG